MSELKVYHCNEWHNEYTEFYLKDEVEAAIDELKAAHHKERHEYIKMIAELKQKLEDVQSTAYAESVDAGMRERRLKRALWLSRAWGANQRTKYLDLFLTGRAHAIRKYKWIKITSKCRAKAEEYK